MNTWIDTNSTDLDECLEMTRRALQACHDLHYALNFPGLTTNVVKYTKGKKYTRVYVERPDSPGGYVMFFVENSNGDVWKAAGWKGPALNFTRGNIFSVEGRKAISLDRLSDKGHIPTGF